MLQSMAAQSINKGLWKNLRNVFAMVVVSSLWWFLSLPLTVADQTCRGCRAQSTWRLPLDLSACLGRFHCSTLNSSCSSLANVSLASSPGHSLQAMYSLQLCVQSFGAASSHRAFLHIKREVLDCNDERELVDVPNVKARPICQRINWHDQWYFISPTYFPGE